MDTQFEPTIVGFLCNWCNQEGGGASGRTSRPVSGGRADQIGHVGRIGRTSRESRDDQGGRSRQGFPASIRTIRVMCAALLPTRLVIEALQRGADGVLAVGCHREGECRYVEGGAADRLEGARQALEDLGINPERLRIEWVPGGDMSRLSELAADFADRLRVVGPNPRKRSAGRPARLTPQGPAAPW